jgi:homeodomain-containing protein/Homeodomain-like domain-containing protein
MSGPAALPITLTPPQQLALERIVRRHTSPQALVRRAQIILAAANGEQNDLLARRLGCTRKTVRTWRARWAAAEAQLALVEADADELLLLIEALLADAPRPGTPDTFSAEQIVQIVALACTPPASVGRPVEAWTPRELADEAIKQQLVATISPRSVERFLTSGRSQAAPKSLLAEHQGA